MSGWGYVWSGIGCGVVSALVMGLVTRTYPLHEVLADAGGPGSIQGGTVFSAYAGAEALIVIAAIAIAGGAGGNRRGRSS